MSSDAAGAVTGATDQAQGLVPKLRFPEFRDAGAWHFEPLSTLAKRRNRRNTGEDISRVLTNSAEHGVVDQRDYFEKDIAVQGNLETYFVVELGDYVYNPRISSLAPVGPIGKNKVGLGVMSPLYTVFGFDRDQDGFYEQFFRSGLWHNHMRLVSNSGARHDRMAVSNDDFMSMPIPAPSSAEQQRIADCLSSLDALIAAEGERLAAVKEHKEGLLQALFPAEGQSTPRLRFPEFRDAGEWVEKPLGEVLACPAAYGANAAAVPYDAGLPTYLRITDISEGGRFLDSGRTSVDVVADGSNTMQIGDIALARTGASVGKAYLHTDADSSLVFAGFLIRVRPDQRRALSQIVFQYMQTERYWAWVARTSARSGQPGINAAEYGALPVPLPPQAAGKKLGEQQRIAGCLMTLDDVISTAADRVDALRNYKFGLMQQLFPSSVQVTT